jgi:hypothetical protein
VTVAKTKSTPKRPRLAKRRTLRARWSKRERDILYSYPRHGSEGALLHYHFGVLQPAAFPAARIPEGKTLLQELEERGFDLTTLRFSIAVKE